MCLAEPVRNRGGRPRCQLSILEPTRRQCLVLWSASEKRPSPPRRFLLCCLRPSPARLLIGACQQRDDKDSPDWQRDSARPAKRLRLDGGVKRRVGACLKKHGGRLKHGCTCSSLAFRRSVSGGICIDSRRRTDLSTKPFPMFDSLGPLSIHRGRKIGKVTFPSNFGKEGQVLAHDRRQPDPCRHGRTRVPHHSGC